MTSSRRSIAPLQRLLLVSACAATLALAAGCATPPAATTEPAAAQTQWSGRLSLLVESDPPQSLHAAFTLSGSAQAGELALHSPLGTTIATARWSPGGATLTQGESSRRYAGIDALTLELTGTALPLAALFDWLKGRSTPVDGWLADLSDAASGRLRARRVQPEPAASLRLVLER